MILFTIYNIIILYNIQYIIYNILLIFTIIFNNNLIKLNNIMIPIKLLNFLNNEEGIILLYTVAITIILF